MRLSQPFSDVRIFLMPSDMVGIYNGGGALTRPAEACAAHKSQHQRELWESYKAQQVSKKVVSFT